MLEENLFLIIILLLALYHINKIVMESNNDIIHIVFDTESIPSRSEEKKEGMSLGTVQQIYSNDNQNIALNGYGNRRIRSGNFSLRFNEPTKIISGTLRGARAKRDDKLEIVEDAYTGNYAKLPLFDIAKPLDSYNTHDNDDIEKPYKC